MRIAFVWDWPPEAPQVMTWQDGLEAALVELRKRGHEVEVFMPGDSNYAILHPDFKIQVCSNVAVVVHVWEPDVILCWADMTRPNAKPLKELNKPMAVCFAGGNIDGENAPLFDHIFVESLVYLNKLKDTGYTGSIAFGTNTDLFAPVPAQHKVFDALAVGTFAAWKRHELFAAATHDLIACAVGYMYPDSWEKECYQVCEAAGNLVLPHSSLPVIKRLMAGSRCVIVPSRSDGGSQRTVLEAMAMNTPVIVCDSDKFDFAGDLVFRADPNIQSIRGYLGAILDGDYEVETREFVEEFWSHKTYADSIEEVLKSIT